MNVNGPLATRSGRARPSVGDQVVGARSSISVRTVDGGAQMQQQHDVLHLAQGGRNIRLMLEHVQPGGADAVGL